MAKRRDVYYCNSTGVTIEVLNDGGVENCFGQDMELLVENTKEAAAEKHIPVIESIAEGYKVQVGSILHPMEEVHYIEWIELSEGDKVQIKFLNPGDQPITEFKTDAKEVKSRAFCNLHGLWKSN